MKRNVWLLLVLVAAVCWLPGQASATATYEFCAITNNNPGAPAAGEAQLRMEVTDLGGDQVGFKFSDNGPIAMSITDIYFDDGTLLGISSINQSAGVDFSQLATPADLPGGNLASPPFITTAGFSADSNPPIEANGVNPGEWVQIVFTLIDGSTFSDTLAALADGSLRAGLHVQAIGTIGGSESFVNCPPAPIPGSLLLLGTGLLGLVGLRRKLH